MKIYPAIDLKEGQCVRLKQGKFDQMEIFSNDPVAVAVNWAEAGAELIHVVDLDGALSGAPGNLGPIRKILGEVRVPIQVGGGIREMEIIRKYIAMGVSRVVLGTSVVKNLGLLKLAAETYPGRIVAGIDAKGGKVAITGWTDVTSESAMEYAVRISSYGIAAVIYTDIDKDGMMEGPNIPRITEMASAISVPLVVSGGVSSLEDVRKILKVGNVEGMIIGKALYSGAVSLKEAVSLTREPNC